MQCPSHSNAVLLFAAVVAVATIAGCDYNSPFKGDPSLQDQEAGMAEITEETGGIDQDPTIGGGQAGFDQ